MANDVLDIGAKHGYPANALSNFAAHPFVMDGVDCASMEGFLQALKFNKPHIQVEVCKLTGIRAKNRGKEHNKHWKLEQKLWWGTTEYDRHGDEYQHLLDIAFLELTRQSPEYRQALIDTGDAKLTHTIGRTSEFDTILTQREFCRRLERLRDLVINNADLGKVSRL